jgi:hypothetical protein
LEQVLRTLTGAGLNLVILSAFENRL